MTRAPTTSVLEELLADGQFGAAGYEALKRTVRSVVSHHGYPPPEGHSRWDEEAVTEVAHDFLADTRTPKRLAHLALHALDDVGFDRLLYRMALNFLRDCGRRTETGRLMLRLRDVLGASDEFVAETGDRWRLASQPAQPSSAAPADLAAAASAEPDVTVPRWSNQTRRNAPVADAPSLARLSRRALEAAGGTLALDALAHAISPRLGLGPTPIAQPVDQRDVFESVGVPHHAEAVVDSIRAAEVLGALGERERLLLASWDTPLRELRDVIGLGPTQAGELKSRLLAFITLELRDEDDGESVLLHLLDQARAWASEQRGAVQRQVNMT